MFDSIPGTRTKPAAQFFFPVRGISRDASTYHVDREYTCICACVNVRVSVYAHVVGTHESGVVTANLDELTLERIISVRIPAIYNDRFNSE